MSHFKKMCTSFRAKAGVDMEGANLSAIAKEPDELELLLTNMIEDAENTEKLKQDEKLKKTQLAKQLARIEAAGLGHQGRINTPDSILDTKDDSDDVDGDGDGNCDEENFEPNAIVQRKKKRGQGLEIKQHEQNLLNMISNAFKENDEITKLAVEKELLAIEERKLNIEKERQQLSNNMMMVTIMQQLAAKLCSGAPSHDQNFMFPPFYPLLLLQLLLLSIIQCFNFLLLLIMMSLIHIQPPHYVPLLIRLRMLLLVRLI